MIFSSMIALVIAFILGISLNENDTEIRGAGIIFILALAFVLACTITYGV